MKEEMKKSKVVEMWNGIRSLEGRLLSVKFGYGCALNKKIMSPIVEALDECVKPDKDYETYEEARKKLLQNMSKKDEHNKPIEEKQENGSTIAVLEDYMEYQKALEELQEEHREAYDRQNDRLTARADMLKDTIELDIHKIKLSEVPKIIEPYYISMLEPLLEDDTEEVDKCAVLVKENKALTEEVKALKEELKDK